MSTGAGRWIACYVLLGLVRAGAALAFVWACKGLVDIATGGSQRSLGVMIPLMFGIMLLQFACRTAIYYCENYGILSIKHRLRKRLFEALLSSRWNGMEPISTVTP